MSVLDQLGSDSAPGEPTAQADPLLPLIVGRSAANVGLTPLGAGIVVGELIGIGDDGLTPLVVFPGQIGSAAVAARSIVDVHGAHIGSQVVLVFEAADCAKPIVMGILRNTQRSPLEQQPTLREVESDGERIIVTAKAQLVLRCGKASITLTKAGKVLIEGAYISSRATGVNRVKGGCVQLN